MVRDLTFFHLFSFIDWANTFNRLQLPFLPRRQRLSAVRPGAEEGFQLGMEFAEQRCTT